MTFIALLMFLKCHQKNDKSFINAKINRTYLFKNAIHKPLVATITKNELSEEIICFVLKTLLITQMFQAKLTKPQPKQIEEIYDLW